MTGLGFPGSSSLPVLGMGVTFASLHSWGTSHSCQEQATIPESGLAVASASSLRAHGGIPSGFLDFSLFSQGLPDPVHWVSVARLR